MFDLLKEGDVVQHVARRLTSNAALSREDCDAFLALLHNAEVYEAGTTIVQHGARCQQAWILLDGFMLGEVGSRHKLRQVVTFHLAGEVLDLHGALTGITGETIVAVTDCKVGAIAADELSRLIEARPQVGRALLIETLIEASIAREWIMNVGQRSARQRITHLGCELAWRARQAGLGDGRSFPLPMTTQQLADATGLTRLHISHIMQKLEAEGLIVCDGPIVRIIDEARFREDADFDELYLCPGTTH